MQAREFVGAAPDLAEIDRALAVSLQVTGQSQRQARRAS
jgi:hypothetical protein